MEKLIRNYNKVDNLILLPNITNVSMNIEQRGEALAKELKRVSKQHQGKKLHVIAHSFTGIDARAAISMFDADMVQSLSTICTPHLGMRLIDNIHAKPDRNIIERVERVFEAVGLSTKNVHEFTTENL